ncbi:MULTISPECIES: membrane protein insertion efficiency factor YidD [Olivibacter]|uniref:Membrane protein insertion efficiency factor YidD n=1 Tax=Olivibacter jilunii TaxID=985016 RepID=A0ABW6B0D6_9SPHI
MMSFRFLLLIPIKVYWLLVPKSKRRCCIFHESCSKHVFRITKEDGLIHGLKALKQRYKSCRAGYSFMLRDGDVSVHLANGDFIEIGEASQ